MPEQVSPASNGSGARRPRTWRWWALRAGIGVFVLVGGALGAQRALAPRATSADLVYATRSPSQKLDLYLPPGPGPFPVVVYIHGGAFRVGDKREPFLGFYADIRRLNALGIALASINYRMSGEAVFPAAVVDAKAAVRWLRANAARLNVNPDAIGVWGKSAGANLALQVALTADDPALYDASLGMADVSDRVQAAISMFGPTDFLSMDRQLGAAGCGPGAMTHDAADSPESRYIGAPIQQNAALARQASPVSHLSATAPPMLIQAGTADCTVPGEQSRELYQLLLPVVGAERVSLQMLEGAGHGDSRFDGKANLDVVADFLQGALLNHKR